ncbi:lactonizing lipase [Photobacterium leiognathi lrivu.4.1]|uniref:Lactonizing lipase n=3 Tax=Vibrionaceae TaxID=641 RepID=V5ES30_PHOLE|nr:putative lactonizing lipase [Vibrio angustum S14] [Photobacterium angustum S14]GAD32576.1 lactonizing lipase [Photobacterium leiognathi lrivu.4.1]
MKVLCKLILCSVMAWDVKAESFGERKGYTETKYPIVLVHGLLGFDSLAGFDYFYGIPQTLSKSGAKVYVAQISATNSTEVRGEQLLAQVENVLAVTGAKKVNLIGHSHGAPTSRYVASVAPQIVASVTSVGGVNKGSKVADLVRNTIPEDSVSEKIAVELSKALTTLIGILSGGLDLPQDGLGALKALTTKGALTFNKLYPEGVPLSSCGDGEWQADNGVYYYSWTGTATYTNVLDPTDAAMFLLGLTFDEPNDGLVAKCSSHLGRIIRDDYKMNHLDEINGLLGIHHLFETDPKTLYRQHANRLQQQGL